MGATADCGHAAESGYRAAPFERQLCEVRYWRRKSSDFKPKTVNEKFAGADEAVPPGSTRISVIDPKTGNSLWSDIRKTDNAKAATHMLDGLREAFDQKHK